MNRFAVMLLLMIAPSSAGAVENAKPVFIKTTCDGRISSAALSSFREEIRSSQKYQAVNTLDESGGADVVLTIHMNCTEHSDIAAMATSFGHAKCFGPKNCHVTVDGNSIRSTLCDAGAAAECGRALFKMFDEYANNPLAPRL